MTEPYNREGWGKIGCGDEWVREDAWQHAVGRDVDFVHIEDMTVEQAEAEFAKWPEDPSGPHPVPPFTENELIAVYRMHYLRAKEGQTNVRE